MRAIACTFFLFLAFALTVSPCCSSPLEDSLRIVRKQEMLLDRQIANQEAQATYYRQQIESFASKPDKSLWQNIKENPAPALGVIGAFVAAMVALISFVFNYRATQRNQTDTQFYEAMKRFGEQSSSATRASAAGLLAQMGTRTRWVFHRGLIRRQRPYLETAIDQLIVGIRTEESLTALESIGDSLQPLIALSPPSAYNKLIVQNEQLRNRFIDSMCDYYAINEFIYSHNSTSQKDILQLAEIISGYHHEIIQSLMQDSNANAIQRMIATRTARVKALPPQAQSDYRSVADQKLELTADQIRQSVNALACTLRHLSPANASKGSRRFKLGPVSLNGIFLVGANLNGVDLSKSSVHRAHLQDSSFIGAQLQGTSFDYTNLNFADFQHADLNDSSFKYTKLQGVSFQSSNLSNVSFSDIDFTPRKNHAGYSLYTNFSSSKLNGASFVDCHLKNVAFVNASGDRNTIMQNSDWWAAYFTSSEPLPTDLIVALYNSYSEDLSAIPQQEINPNTLRYFSLQRSTSGEKRRGDTEG